MVVRTIDIDMAINGDGEKEYGDGAAWIRGPLLGKGSFGRVYKATLKKGSNNRGSMLTIKDNGNHRFPSVMAVKSAEVSISGTLKTEKEVMCNFNDSPYVITCFGDEATVGQRGVVAYNLLLEYASGGTLSDRIKKSGVGGMPEPEVRAHTQSILRGVSHIHSLGYVHCDLKPDNILLVPNGEKSEFRAKIGDFGLAKRGKQQPHNKKRKLTEPCSWRGTPMYLSPEAVIDNVQEAACDVWAVGCIVFKMLTGKPPWEGKNAEDVLTKIRASDLELPKIPKEISEDARDFLTCCFERNPLYRLTAELLLEHPFVDEDSDYSSGSDSKEEEEDVDESVEEKEMEYWVWARRENHPISLSNIPAVNLMRLVARC